MAPPLIHRADSSYGPATTATSARASPYGSSDGQEADSNALVAAMLANVEMSDNPVEAMRQQLAQLESTVGAHESATGGGLDFGGFPQTVPGMEHAATSSSTGFCSADLLAGMFGEPDASGEATLNSGGFPIRPGREPCAFYMKTGFCRFGPQCKKDHPEKPGASTQDVTPPQLNSKGLPVRPGRGQCATYMQTGECRFGVHCTNDHPELGARAPAATRVPASGPGSSAATGSAWSSLAAELRQSAGLGGGMNSAGFSQRSGAQVQLHSGSFPPRALHPSGEAAPHGVQLNSKGYPIRPGADHCAFYMKNRFCRFGVQCKKDHPEHDSSTPSTEASVTAQTGVDAMLAGMFSRVAAPSGMASVTAQSGADLFAGMLAGTVPFAEASMNSGGFPSRPGKEACAFYMKTGTCRFGAQCKKDHPETGLLATNRAVNSAAGSTWSNLAAELRQSVGFIKPATSVGAASFSQGPAEEVQLNSLGFPLRPGQEPCRFYMNTRNCSFGRNCRKDHPEPEFDTHRLQAMAGDSNFNAFPPAAGFAEALNGDSAGMADQDMAAMLAMLASNAG